MQQTLTENQLGHALFYSLKINDFDHAEYLLTIDAPVNTSFFIEQDVLMYTTNLLVGKAAQVIKKYGVSHAKSQLLLRILDMFIQRKCDFRCHCSPKNPHYCSLSQAFKYITFQTEEDLLKEQNLLILKLLYNGGTYKNLQNSKIFCWNGIKILNSYIDTKKEQVIQLTKMNRHTKGCSNRHSSCCNKRTQIKKI